MIPFKVHIEIWLIIKKLIKVLWVFSSGSNIRFPVIDVLYATVIIRFFHNFIDLSEIVILEKAINNIINFKNRLD